MNDRLPSERDFLDHHGCLDAQSAWDHFGGLSVDQAFMKFSENPLYYQEDFMWMGRAAFAHYYPVLDRYVRDCLDSDEEGAWDDFKIIAEGILMQLDIGKARLAESGRMEAIHSLSQSVLSGSQARSEQKVSKPTYLFGIERSWQRVHDLTSPD